MRIIYCTSKNAKSMNEIMEETNIARTTIHRKINSMVQDELLLVENFTISKDGKKSRLFRSRISNIQIKYEGRDMFVTVEENSRRPSQILLRTSKKESNESENGNVSTRDLPDENETLTVKTT